MDLVSITWKPISEYTGEYFRNGDWFRKHTDREKQAGYYEYVQLVRIGAYKGLFFIDAKGRGVDTERPIESLYQGRYQTMSLEWLLNNSGELYPDYEGEIEYLEIIVTDEDYGPRRIQFGGTLVMSHIQDAIKATWDLSDN